MKERILELERIAKELEPSVSQRKRVRDKIVRYTEEFLKKIETIKTYRTTPDKGKGLLKFPIRETSTDMGSVLNLIRDHVDTPGINPASSGHLGYIPGGGIYYAALGDYLAAVTNRYAGVFFANPGAVRMENMLIRWTARILGYPPSAAGNLTTGGSLGNLIAIVTARDAKDVRARNVERSAIYLTSQVHHSVDKAIRIAGLKEAVIRYIPVDSRFRMNAKELENQIQQDKKQGLRPFLVIASAGTTDVGAVDPLEDIGFICKKENLWYHVDAAYGGYFILTRQGRKKLRGIEMSDSVVIDPHKGLFLPYGTGIVVVKDWEKLHASHYYFAHYMQDAVTDRDERSPAELSPELTKHFRGMRLWLPLMLHGVKPFRACLEEKLLLAKYFYEEVKKLGFETGPEPELSVVTYRYIPPKGNPDEFNKKLLHAVLNDGRIFISSTILDGKFTLRFACLAFRTHLKTVDLLLHILKENVKKLLADGNK